MGDMGDGDRGSRGIQSVEIGTRVIEALRRAAGPMTLKEIGAAAEIEPSNCHRYLASWVRTGFVTQDRASGRYDLGPAVIRAGLAALSRLDAVAIGTEAIVEAVEATGHSGLLAVWGDPAAVIVRWLAGRRAVRTTLATGSSLPLIGSATGHVFLAWLPDRVIAPLVGAGGEADAAHRLAADVRARGYATVSGDHIPGLSALAAPVLDAYGEAAAAVTLVGLADGFSANETEALLAAARAASRRLGWRDE